MKKINIFILLIPVLTFVCLFSACKTEDVSTANITFENNYIVIEKYYYVGDEIKLNGQNIDYYADIKDTEPTESDIAITKDMISNFSTQKTGEFNFKLTYKKASREINYYVYEKPDITESLGYYTCSLFGQNVVAEIKPNKVVVNFYENGYTDITTDKPTSSASIDSTLKANKDGNPSICFVYEQNDYEFCVFTNGIPTKVKRIINNKTEYSSMEVLCTKIA